MPSSKVSFHFESQRPSTRCLLYTDREGVAHAMLWVADRRWMTGCGIGLGLCRDELFVPGQLHSAVYIDNISMGSMTCMGCIDAEAGGTLATRVG